MKKLTTYQDFVRVCWKTPESEAYNLLHIATGFAGEIIELFEASSLDNHLEEIGDANFYLVAGQLYFPIHGPLVAPFPEPIPRLREKLISVSGELLDYAKKSFFYGKPVPRFMIGEILEYASQLLEHYVELMGFSSDEVIARNITKLKLRYPEGYTDEAARNRADKGKT
jgi:hypothetical protein